MVWRQVRTDVLRSKRAPSDPLPHLHDVGCEGGLDRIETLKCCKSSLDNAHKWVLRTVLCNGVLDKVITFQTFRKSWPVSNLSALRTGEKLRQYYICGGCALRRQEYVGKSFLMVMIHTWTWKSTSYPAARVHVG